MLTWFNKQKYSPILWVGIIVCLFITYALVGILPLDRQILPFIWGEDCIPFLPWTFIIYLSLFIQYFVVIRRIPQKALGILVYRFLWMMGIALLFFIVAPIEYPRYLYPGNGFVNLFRMIDASGNCFPSLHVVETLFLAACYSFFEKNIFYRVGMWLWAVVIIFSVLTTKQHYLVDIIGGVVLVVPFIFIIKNDLVRQKILD